VCWVWSVSAEEIERERCSSPEGSDLPAGLETCGHQLSEPEPCPTPTSVPAATELSLAIEASGRPDEGERALSDALAACTETGSREELWRVLGDILLRSDSCDSKLHACDAFDESLRLDADSVHAHRGKGACLRKQGLLHLELLSYESATTTDATP